MNEAIDFERFTIPGNIFQFLVDKVGSVEKRKPEVLITGPKLTEKEMCRCFLTLV